MAGIEKGSIRATVLIETLPAVFQMDEILYELRDHSVGLNCGRWDYIFSYVKTFQGHPDRLLPDRVQVGMTQHFMKSYSDLLIRTCHRRGVHAMGGMVCESNSCHALFNIQLFLVFCFHFIYLLEESYYNFESIFDIEGPIFWNRQLRFPLEMIQQQMRQPLIL